MKLQNYTRYLLIGFIVIIAVIAIIGFLVSKSSPQDSSVSSPQHRVITSGRTLRLLGLPYKVLSAQYIKVTHNAAGYPLIKTFHSSVFNASEVDAVLSEMKQKQFNTVRLVLNTGTDFDASLFGNHCKESATQYSITQCFDPLTLSNLAYTIRKAYANNIRVILSFTGGVPFTYYSSPSTPYTGTNIHFLKEETIRDHGRFVVDVLKYLNTQGVVNAAYLAIQPYAEPYINIAEYPFTLSRLNKGTFFIPNNVTVNNQLKNKTNGVTNVNLEPIVNHALINSFNHWHDKIKAYDPQMLTLYDQFPAYAVQGESRNVSDDILTNSFLKADIVGMQLYPDYFGEAEASVRKLMEFTPKKDFLPKFSDQIAAINKPFMVIEFGFPETGSNAVITQADMSKLTAWINQTCSYKPVGWNFFNWSADNFTYVTARQNNFLIGNQLRGILASACAN